MVRRGWFSYHTPTLYKQTDRQTDRHAHNPSDGANRYDLGRLKINKDAHSIAESGVMYGGTPLVVDGAAVSASNDQFVNYLDVTEPTGDVQRRLTVVVGDVQLSAVTHQQLQRRHPACLVYRVPAAVT